MSFSGSSGKTIRYALNIDNCDDVSIGKLIWKNRNLCKTVDNEGYELVLGRDYFYPNNDANLAYDYGFLYTRNAAMRIIDKGWRIPTINDWVHLKMETVNKGNMSLVLNEKLWFGKEQSGKRKSFCAVPSGKKAIRFYETDFGNAMYVWLNPNDDESDITIRTPFGYISDSKIMYVRNAHEDNGFSVRLVKNM